MRKWLGYILTLYILLCAVVPCTIFDRCEDEKTVQTFNKNSNDDCNSCLPFSTCSACHAFPLSRVAVTIDPPASGNAPLYGYYTVASKSDYSSRLFQPPRL